jgi:hypothetical protein
MKTPLLALLLVLGQEPAAREEARGLVFTRPKGWVKTENPNTSTALTPPGLGAGEECTLILYPTSSGFSGTDQELGDSVFQSVTMGSTVHGEPSTGKLGLFQTRRARMTTSAGLHAWIVVFSGKSADTIGAGVFIAGSEALLKTHGPVVDELLREMRFARDEAPSTPQAIHGLVIPLSAGWTRKDEAGGIVSLHPPPPRSALEPTWDYVMYVLPSQPLLGTFWQTHKAVFQEAIKSSQLKDPVPPSHNPDEPGPFIRSASAGHDAAGGVRAISMYSALSDGKIECILIHNQEDRDGLRRILARTAVKTPPKKVERPRIVEAYRLMDQKQYINIDGSTSAGSLQYERIWLRSDGVADFTTYYPEGYASAAVVLKQDPGLADGRIGSWKARGDAQVEVVRTEGVPATLCAREDGKLRHGSQLWQPMPRVDGVRLEGRWSRKPAPGGPQFDPIWIELTKDGRFKDEGVLDHVTLSTLERGKPPKRGSGTYELRDWTIFLRYDDGTSWSTDFSTIGSDARDHSAILFGTFAFPKE